MPLFRTEPEENGLLAINSSGVEKPNLVFQEILARQAKAYRTFSTNPIPKTRLFPTSNCGRYGAYLWR